MIQRKTPSGWEPIVDLVPFVAAEEPPPDPDPEPNPGDTTPGDTTPYTLPSEPPYNAPVAAITPTYDGSGQAVHPSVVDFGTAWHGFRYWCAITPYPGANDRYEDPSVIASHDGYTWQVPAGLTNPLYPAPAAPGFNSDTHLVYDPAAGELVLYYRETLDASTFTHWVMRSGDAVTWSARVNINLPTEGVQILSPALVYVAQGDWRLFGLTRAPEPRVFQMWTSSSPEGPWSGPYGCVGLRDFTYPWHLDVLYFDGLFWLTVDRGPYYLAQPDGLRAATSRDGITWTAAAEDFMEKGGTGAWDEQQLYRASIQPHEDGTRHRMWYSATSEDNEWRTGFTAVPRSEWPTPPAFDAGTGTAYRDETLADSPGLYWRLGENIATTTAADASGNGRTGAYVGSVGRGATSLSGDADSGVWLDGFGRVERDFEEWMSVSAFTVEAIIVPTLHLGNQGIFGVNAGATGWWIGKDSSAHRLYFAGGGKTLRHFGSTLDLGTAYHVAFTTDGSTGRLYINGSPSADVTGLSNVAPDGGTLIAGAVRTSSTVVQFGWHGGLDELAIYPGATLSGARILAHAQAAGLA